MGLCKVRTGAKINFDIRKRHKGVTSMVLPIIAGAAGLAWKFGLPAVGGILSYQDRKRRGQSEQQAIAGASAEAAAGALVFPGIAAVGKLGRGAYLANNSYKAAVAFERSAKAAKAARALGTTVRNPGVLARAGSVAKGAALGTARIGRDIAIGSGAAAAGGSLYDATQAKPQAAQYPALPSYAGYQQPRNPQDLPANTGLSNNYLFAGVGGTALAAGGYALSRRGRAPLPPRQPKIVNVPQVNLGPAVDRAASAARSVGPKMRGAASRAAGQGVEVAGSVLKTVATAGALKSSVAPKRGAPNPEAVKPAVKMLDQEIRNLKSVVTGIFNPSAKGPKASTPRSLTGTAFLPARGPLAVPKRLEPSLGKDLLDKAKPGFRSQNAIIERAGPAGPKNPNGSAINRPLTPRTLTSGPNFPGKFTGSVPVAPVITPPVTIAQRVQGVLDRYRPGFGPLGVGNRATISPEVLRSDVSKELRLAQRSRALTQMSKRGIQPMDTYRGPQANQATRGVNPITPRVINAQRNQAPVPVTPIGPKNSNGSPGIRPLAQRARSYGPDFPGRISGPVSVPRASVAPAPKVSGNAGFNPARVQEILGSMSAGPRAQLEKLMQGLKAPDAPGALVRTQASVNPAPSRARVPNAAQVSRLPLPARTSQRVLVTDPSATQVVKYRQRLSNAPKPFASVAPSRFPAVGVPPGAINQGPIPDVRISDTSISAPRKAPIPASRALVPVSGAANRGLVPTSPPRQPAPSRPTAQPRPQVLTSPPSTGGFGPAKSMVNGWIAEGRKLLNNTTVAQSTGRTPAARPAGQTTLTAVRPPAASPTSTAARFANQTTQTAVRPAATGRTQASRVASQTTLTSPGQQTQAPKPPAPQPRAASGRRAARPFSEAKAARVAQGKPATGPAVARTPAVASGPVTRVAEAAKNLKIGGFQIQIPAIPRVGRGRIAAIAAGGTALVAGAGAIINGMPQAKTQFGTTKGNGPFAEAFNQMFGNKGQQEETNAIRAATALQQQEMRNQASRANANVRAAATVTASQNMLAGRDPQAFARLQAQGSGKSTYGPAFGQDFAKTSGGPSSLADLEAVSTRNQRIRDAAAAERKEADRRVALATAEAKASGVQYQADRGLQGTRYTQDQTTARQRIQTGGQVQIAQGDQRTKRYQADRTYQGVSVQANAGVRKQQIQTSGQVRVAGLQEGTKRYQADRTLQGVQVRTSGDIRRQQIQTGGQVQVARVQELGKRYQADSVARTAQGQQQTQRYQSDNTLRGTQFETRGRIQISAQETSAKRYQSDNELKATQRKAQADEYGSNQDMFARTASAQASAAGAAQAAATKADPELMMAYGEDEIKAIKKRRALAATFEQMRKPTVGYYS